MMKKLIAFLFLLAQLIPGAVLAGEYELVKGKGVEVCEVCKKNLELLSGKDMACDRQYSTALKLHTPHWKPVDLKKNRDLLERVLNVLNLGQEIPDEEQRSRQAPFENYLKTLAENGSQIYTTPIDIDNDGHLDNVLKLDVNACRQSASYAKALVVLNEESTKLDISKTDLVLQNGGSLIKRPGSTFYVGAYFGQMYGVFRFNKQTYFDKWDDLHERQTLKIYKAVKGQTTEVCKYKYVSDEKGGPK